MEFCQANQGKVFGVKFQINKCKCKFLKCIYKISSIISYLRYNKSCPGLVIVSGSYESIKIIQAGDITDVNREVCESSTGRTCDFAKTNMNKCELNQFEGFAYNQFRVSKGHAYIEVGAQTLGSESTLILGSVSTDWGQRVQFIIRVNLEVRD